MKWEDIVRPTRVLDLKEVINEQRLSVKQLLDAGVRQDIAEKAYAASHTAKQEIVRAARQQALKNLEAAGISREQVHKHVAGVIGQRIGIGAGPSGPSVIKLPAKRAVDAITEAISPKLPARVKVALDHFAGNPIPAAPIPKKVPQAIAATIAVEEAAELFAAYEAYLADAANPRLTLAEFKKLRDEKRNP